MAQSIWDLLSPQSAAHQAAANFVGMTPDGRPLATSNMGGSYGNYIVGLPDGSWSIASGPQGKLPYWSRSLGPAPPEYQFQPDMVQPGTPIQTRQEAEAFKQQHGGISQQQWQPNASQNFQQSLIQQNAADNPNAYQQQMAQQLQQAFSQMSGAQPQQQQNQWASTLPAMGQSQSPWGFQTQPGGYNWSQMPGMPYQNYGGQQFQPQTMQWNNPFMSQRPAQGGAGASGMGDSYQSRTYGGQWSRPAGENRAMPTNNGQPNNLWSRPAILNRGTQSGRGLFYNY